MFGKIAYNDFTVWNAINLHNAIFFAVKCRLPYLPKFLVRFSWQSVTQIIGKRFWRMTFFFERLCSLSGTFLPWKKEVKYLGIYLVSSKHFKISTEHSIEAHSIVRLTLYLCHWRGCLTSTANQMRAYLVIWAWSLLNKENRLRFTRLCRQQVFFMKLFHTSNIDIVKECHMFFFFCF